MPMTTTPDWNCFGVRQREVVILKNAVKPIGHSLLRVLAWSESCCA